MRRDAWASAGPLSRPQSARFREPQSARFRAHRKLIAQYNIACCYGALGDKPQAMEIVRSYLSQVREPLDQVNEMLSDEDFAPLRDELRELREELKREREKSGGGLFGFLPKLNMRELADGIGVEWKD